MGVIIPAGPLQATPGSRRASAMGAAPAGRTSRRSLSFEPTSGGAPLGDHASSGVADTMGTASRAASALHDSSTLSEPVPEAAGVGGAPQMDDRAATAGSAAAGVLNSRAPASEGAPSPLSAASHAQSTSSPAAVSYKDAVLRAAAGAAPQPDQAGSASDSPLPAGTRSPPPPSTGSPLPAGTSSHSGSAAVAAQGERAAGVAAAAATDTAPLGASNDSVGDHYSPRSGAGTPLIADAVALGGGAAAPHQAVAEALPSQPSGVELQAAGGSPGPLPQLPLSFKDALLRQSPSAVHTGTPAAAGTGALDSPIARPTSHQGTPRATGAADLSAIAAAGAGASTVAAPTDLHATGPSLETPLPDTPETQPGLVSPSSRQQAAAAFSGSSSKSARSLALAYATSSVPAPADPGVGSSLRRQSGGEAMELEAAEVPDVAAAVAGQLAQLRADANAAARRLADSNADVEELTRQLRAAKGEAVVLRKQLQDAEAQVAALDEQLAEIGQENDALQAQLAEAEVAAGGSAEQLRVAHEQLAAANAACEELQQRVSEIDSRSCELADELQQRKEEHEAALAEMSRVEEGRVGLSKQLAEVRAEVGGERQRLLEQLAAAQGACGTLKEEVECLQGRVRGLEEKLQVRWGLATRQKCEMQLVRYRKGCFDPDGVCCTLVVGVPQGARQDHAQALRDAEAASEARDTAHAEVKRLRDELQGAMDVAQVG